MSQRALETVEERKLRLSKYQSILSTACADEEKNDFCDADADDADDDNWKEKKTMRLRNYVPRDSKAIDCEILTNAKAEEFVALVETLQTSPLTDGTDEDLDKCFPRKQNQDLKRLVARKMGKLERLTEKAIAEIAHEQQSQLI